MNYYTSDLHFGHANIIKFCDRPWKQVDEMDKALIENWNNRVTDADHIYHLGDFSMNKGRFIKLVEQLNGQKHFIIGNHDPKGIQHELRKLKNVFVHDSIHTVKDEGRKVVLCHYPIFEWNGYYHGTVHFHGHTHGSIGDNFKSNAFDVGTDCHDYEPKTYDEIVGDRFVNVRFNGPANVTNKPEDRVDIK